MNFGKAGMITANCFNNCYYQYSEYYTPKLNVIISNIYEIFIYQKKLIEIF